MASDEIMVRYVPKILICGFGNLGRRHLQGIFKQFRHCEVVIIDPRRACFSDAEQFFTTIGCIERLNTCVMVNDIEALRGTYFDMIIQAETVDARFENSKSLAENIKSGLWLIEKPVCASPLELKNYRALSKTKKIFVNHFRRVDNLHKNIKHRFESKGRICLFVEGKEINIASNISHYIDLINFWTKALPVTVNTSGLDREWVPQKRTGFFDVRGKIEVLFSDGSKLCVQDTSTSPIVVWPQLFGSFSDSSVEFQIFEEKGGLIIGSKFFECSRVSFQSELTGLVLKSWMHTAQCELPKLELVLDCNEKVLRELEVHWKTSGMSSNSAFLPIT